MSSVRYYYPDDYQIYRFGVVENSQRKSDIYRLEVCHNDNILWCDMDVTITGSLRLGKRPAFPVYVHEGLDYYIIWSGEGNQGFFSDMREYAAKFDFAQSSIVRYINAAHESGQCDVLSVNYSHLWATTNRRSKNKRAAADLLARRQVMITS
jgi:hypothetical protein